MLIRFKLILIFIAYAALSQSQELRFSHYSIKDGLPSSQVYDMVQDDYGYIWFSTDRGICRYDGITFETFASVKGMTSNTVFDLVKQKDGRIWCSTINRSLFSIYGEEPEFTPYAYNELLTKMGEPSLVTTSFMRTEDGSLYMCFVNGKGYIRIDSKGKVLKRAALQQSQETYRHTLLANASGQSFFYAEPAASGQSTDWPIVFKSEGTHSPYEYIKASYIAKEQTSVFTSFKLVRIQHKDGRQIELSQTCDPIGLGTFGEHNFWVGLRYGGLHIYDCEGHLLHEFLPGKSVTSCFQDHEGGLWVSTIDDGVYYVKGFQVSYYQLRSNWIQQLACDAKGQLWSAMYNGDIYTLQNNQIESVFTSKSGKPSIVYYDEKVGQIYYIADNQFFSQDNDQISIMTNYSEHMSGSRQTSLVVGAHHSVGTIGESYVSLFNLDQKLRDLIAFDGKIFAASESKLLRYQDNELTDISKLFPVNTHFRALAKSNTHLIVGTENEGLFLLYQGKIRQISKKDGLSSTTVSRIFIENDSLLWLCTNTGINRVNLSGGKVKIDVISTNHGLISNEITDIQIIGNTVWVGSRDGLCSFDKSLMNLQLQKSWTSFLRFTSMRVVDKTRALSSRYDLPYNENRIELSFKAISFKAEENSLCRYRLMGLESKWIYGSGEHIIYSSLAPGTYNFIAQTRDVNGKWGNEQATLSIVIHPPYWKTTWFISSLIIVILSLAYLFFKYRILSYNRDITRELLRQLLKKIRGKQKYVVYRDQGKDIRILSDRIGYIKASKNYLEIHTKDGKHVVRGKIGEFKERVPDPLEYVRVHRSYIVRVDQVEKKGVNEISLLGEVITISDSYHDALEKIQF